MTQGELEGIPLPFEQAMSNLELRVMNEIVQAIKVNGFSTSKADWQMDRLIQLGRSEAAIKKYVQEALDATDREIERIYSNEVYEFYYGYRRAYKSVGATQVAFKDNKELQSLIESVKSQTAGTFRNMTASMGFAIKNPATGKVTYSPLMDFYESTLDSAIMDIMSGTSSYDKALSRAINTMTNSGVRWIDYDSGVHSRVNVAARRAVMTGFRQVQGKINEQVGNELGTDSYEVSYHVGARPSHQEWQGRVYTYRELEDVCGLGSVTGLLGANCYHDYNAFIPGVSVRIYTDEQLDQMMEEENTPKNYNGKEYTTYEALQEQRKMETTMRKTRQDIKLLQSGGAGKDEIILKQAKYQVQMQQYKAFSKSMGLPEQMTRVYQDGLGKVTSNKAVHQKFLAKKVIKTVESGGRFDIIKSKRFNTIDDPMREVIGAAEESHPKELEKIISDLNKAGVIIKRRENVMGYFPAAMPGKPGEIIIEPNASYSAWLHEHQHFCDDREDGYLGLRVFNDIDKCRKREIDAYQKEIDLAREYNRPDIIKRLEDLRDKEVARYDR